MAEYLPALRFRVLTPLFDAVIRGPMRERVFKRALVEQADLRPGQTVLDVGAGTGTLALLVKQAEPGSDVIGLDADPEILERARRKSAEAGLEVRFDEGFSTELPYADGSVDRVLSTLFFHHLMPADKRATIGEIARVLRPGGEVHVADFSRPADPLQAAVGWPARMYDGLERTRENFAGALPGMFEDAGFVDVGERRRYRTVIGTIALLAATKGRQ